MQSEKKHVENIYVEWKHEPPYCQCSLTKNPWKTFTLSENMSRRIFNAVWKKTTWKTFTLSENTSRRIVNAVWKKPVEDNYVKWKHEPMYCQCNLKKPWKTFTLSENTSRRFVNAVWQKTRGKHLRWVKTRAVILSMQSDKKKRGKHLRWVKTWAAVLSMQSEKNTWKTFTLSEIMMLSNNYCLEFV